MTAKCFLPIPWAQASKDHFVFGLFVFPIILWKRGIIDIYLWVWFLSVYFDSHSCYQPYIPFYCSEVWEYTAYLFLVDGHRTCSHILALMNNAGTNVHNKSLCVDMCLHFSWRRPTSGMAGSYVRCLNF